MTTRNFSKRLGTISNNQFQAALDHFKLGTLIKTAPVSFGLFGQNVFVISTTGNIRKC